MKVTCALDHIYLRALLLVAVLQELDSSTPSRYMYFIR
jgi:flagellar biosynthesis regulator FlbT